MDPLTHGLLGAAAAQAVFSRRLGRHAAVVGALAGMAPDLDILWRDPVVVYIHHRAITHSLALAPVWGAIAALPLMAIFRKLRQPWAILGAAILALATHGPLDALTSWGTGLLLPFSSQRLAWDVLSIIDPIFTLVLLSGVAWAAWRKRGHPATAALILALGYVALATVQHERALMVQHALADSRRQVIDRGRAMPTFGNIVLWRSVYETGGQLYADAVRLPLWGRATLRTGQNVPLVSQSQVAMSAALNEPARRDLANFYDFADGYVAASPTAPTVLGDMRYSVTTNGFEPMWGLRLGPAAAGDGPLAWVQIGRRNRGSLIRTMWRDLTGKPAQAAEP